MGNKRTIYNSTGDVLKYKHCNKTPKTSRPSIPSSECNCGWYCMSLFDNPGKLEHIKSWKKTKGFREKYKNKDISVIKNVSDLTVY